MEDPQHDFLVPRLAQRDVQPLRQRVEAVAEEQDAHQGELMREGNPFSRSREKVAGEAGRMRAGRNVEAP